MMASLEMLREIVARHAVEGSSTTVVPGLTLHRSARSTEPVQLLHCPALCIVLQGSKRAFVGSQVFYYDTQSYLIVSLEIPLTSAVVEASERRPYLGLALDLDFEALSSLMLEMASERPDAEVASGLMQSPIEPDLLDPLLRLLCLLDRPADGAILGPMLQREILFRLIQGPQGAMLSQLISLESRMSQIKWATAWIRENFAQPVRIETLADMAGMSPSTFHKHFKTVTAMTPVQYQKQVRLQEARRLLLTNSTNMAGVGFSVGYESPSQFTREYRRMFGMSPGRDVRRLRSGESETDGPSISWTRV